MKSGVAIAVGASAILHVCVLLVLDRVEPPEKKKVAPVRISMVEPRSTPKVAEPEPEPVPMDVVLFEVPAAPTAGVQEAEPRAMVKGTARSTSSIGSASTPTSTPTSMTTGASAEPGGGSGYGKLSMRRPQIDPRAGGFELHEDPEAHRAEAPVEESGELKPNGGGTYRRTRPGFTGYVARDGSVSFKDKKAFSVKWKIPNPFRVAKAAAKGLEDYGRDPWKQVKDAERDWSSGLEVEDYTKHIDEDDSADHGDATIPILGGSTEITDWVMRKVGQDPYQSDKLLWMDQTRDERVQIASVHRERQLKKAVEIVRRHLERVWARTDMDLVAKREAMFELWDDGAEDGDAMLVEAATRTRAAVIGFVRAKLPAGSEGAYSKDELERLNRRRTSRARFEPYE